MVSCDFQKLKIESYIYNSETSLKRIKISIEEAKVLSGLAILNEKIISLSQLSGVMSESYSVKATCNKLKEDHLKIKYNINHLAEKKLILLPNCMNKKELIHFENSTNKGGSIIYLNDVLKLLKIEISQFEYLYSISNDLDFKVLGVKTLVTLKYNYNQIQNILQTNY